MAHSLITKNRLPECGLKTLGAGVYRSINECIACDGVFWVHVSSDNWLEQVKSGAADRKTVIVLTQQLTMSELQQALQAGARGYCLDSAPLNELMDTSNAVKQGGIWVPAGMLGSLVALLSQHQSYSRYEASTLLLTDREKQVVNEVLTGASNMVIAEHLSITVRTVKDHMASIFKKLQVRDRVQLLLKLGHFEVPQKTN